MRTPIDPLRALDAEASPIVRGRHPVLDLIRDRKDSRSRPGARADGNRLALVIEGGGLRGVVSGGMLIALEQLGLRDVFDVVYGASAGAINACYFLTGQAAFGGTIYYEDLLGKEFIDVKRFLTGRPVVDLNYLIDHVMVTEKPLDWEAVINSPIPLYPVASSLTSFKPHNLGRPRDELHLRDQLRASARVLLLGGDPFEIDGHKCLDASLFLGIPYDFAVRDGAATHVLALLTRPAGEERRGLSLFERKIVAPRLARYDPRIPDAMERRIDNYRALVTKLEEKSRAPDVKPPFVFAVQTTTKRIGQLEQDRDELIRGAAAAMQAVFALADVQANIHPILEPFVSSIPFRPPASTPQ